MSKLKLEAGKFYKTRGGRRAEIIQMLDPRLGDDYPARGFIAGDGDEQYSWNLEGNYVTGDTSPYDLVGKWVSHERWVNVEFDGAMSVYSKKSDAESDAEELTTTVGVMIDLTARPGERVREILE